MSVHYELYRKSTLGVCLAESVEELMEQELLPPELASMIMAQFDQSINESFRNVKTKANLKSKLHTYRFCDNVWTFTLENAQFKIDNEVLLAPRVKVVACDAKIARLTDRS